MKAENVKHLYANNNGFEHFCKANEHKVMFPMFTQHTLLKSGKPNKEET